LHGSVLVDYISRKLIIDKPISEALTYNNLSGLNGWIPKIKSQNIQTRKIMNNTLQRLHLLIVVVSLVVLITNCSQIPTDNPNVEIVQGMYDAFAAGDGAAVLAKFSPDIIWNEAESNSLADGNPYVGPQAVAEGVFGRLGQEWETFTLTDQTLYGVGEDMVLVTGRYQGTHARTGKTINAQKVHIWWFEDGMVTRFQQYVDTKQLADAEMELDSE